MAAKSARLSDTAPSDGAGGTRETKSLDDIMDSVGYELAKGDGGASGGGNVSPWNPDRGAAGKALSLNTKDFKYVGYFSGIKEKIEWAWVYPQEARMSGQQGTLTLS
ncbi:MAG: hypothetical protein M5R36_27190, partial [Deltaproteobacteria bacterium]|nr:hypothetical protein [Deltaproteobacteria bacterium]